MLASISKVVAVVRRNARCSRGRLQPLASPALALARLAGVFVAGLGVWLSPAGAQESQPLRMTLPAPAAEVEPQLAKGSVYFVGTATVILRYAGFTILTDPNFLHKGDHAQLGYGLSAQRLTDPALDIDRLPPIDFVLLSHYHGDHFDPVVERKLDKDTPIATTPHAAAQLRERGFRATYALQPWQRLDVSKGAATMKITAMPGRHAPRAVALAMPPVMGAMLEFPAPGGQSALHLYISGDTLVFDELREIPKRYPQIDLALLHLGGTRIFGVLLSMDARQGVELLQMLEPETAIPIHHDDYPMFKSPLADFQRAAREAGLESRVRYLKRGESYEFSVEAERPR